MLSFLEAVAAEMIGGLLTTIIYSCVSAILKRHEENHPVD